MKKEEVTQKLTQMDEKIAALGDLDTLLQNSKELPALIADIQNKKNEFDSLLHEISTQKQEQATLAEKNATLEEQLSESKESVLNLTAQATELVSEAEKLTNETRDQLGVVSNAKLASTFETVKSELNEEKREMFRWLVGAVVVLVVGTGAVVVWQLHEQGTLYHLSFPVRAALLSPIVYFLVFINREYNRVRNLREEYTFKAAISRSFDAYKIIIIEAAGQLKAAEAFTFITDCIKGLYSSPMENIKKNSVKNRVDEENFSANLQKTLEDVIDADTK